MPWVPQVDVRSQTAIPLALLSERVNALHSPVTASPMPAPADQSIEVADCPTLDKLP